MSEPERVSRWVMTMQNGRWLPALVDGMWTHFPDADGNTVRLFRCDGSAGGYGLAFTYDSLEACVASARACIAVRRSDIDATFQKAQERYNNEHMLLAQRDAELAALLGKKESDR